MSFLCLNFLLAELPDCLCLSVCPSVGFGFGFGIVKLQFHQPKKYEKTAAGSNNINNSSNHDNNNNKYIARAEMPSKLAMLPVYCLAGNGFAFGPKQQPRPSPCNTLQSTQRGRGSVQWSSLRPGGSMTESIPVVGFVRCLQGVFGQKFESNNRMGRRESQIPHYRCISKQRQYKRREWNGGSVTQTDVSINKSCSILLTILHIVFETR